MNTCVTGRVEEIKAYYQQRASVDHYATSPDRHLREVEIDYIGRNLADGLRVLDIGCGNGYSTLCHAVKHQAHFIGGDFVPEMVQAAERLRDSFSLKGRVDSKSPTSPVSSMPMRPLTPSSVSAVCSICRRVKHNGKR